MEELIEKYCNEMCVNCINKNSCKYIDNIILIEIKNEKENIVKCNNYIRNAI